MLALSHLLDLLVLFSWSPCRGLCEYGDMVSVEICMMVIIKPQAPPSMTATINFSLGPSLVLGRSGDLTYT